MHKLMNIWITKFQSWKADTSIMPLLRATEKWEGITIVWKGEGWYKY